VNESFEQKFFPGHDAIGRAFVGLEDPAITIVGVVSDAVYNSVRDPMPPAIYRPLAQGGNAPAALNLSVRVASGLPTRLAPSIATTISNSNRDLTFSFRELAEQVDASLAQERIVAILSGFFGASLLGCGLMLGVIVALWTSKFVGALLFDIKPRDPIAQA
jgi:hypothetical protein